MSLQQLVEHFNDNFEKEHVCDFRPFVIRNNKVKGIFGIAHITSQFAPIHPLNNQNLIKGYASQAIAAADEARPFKKDKVNRLLAKTLNKPAHVRSIVSYDRLCRTVNLLNYLTLAEPHHFLITDVDPRHILSIPDHHGAYFEEVIIHSGLKTQNVVISMSITGVHQAHYPQLLAGLNNYRKCGYKFALNIGHLISADKTIAFINQLAPDYVIVAAPHADYNNFNFDSSLMVALRNLKTLTSSLGGKMILKNVKSSEQIACAEQIGFDFIQRGYCEKQTAHKIKEIKYPPGIRQYSYA